MAKKTVFFNQTNAIAGVITLGAGLGRTFTKALLVNTSETVTINLACPAVEGGASFPLLAAEWIAWEHDKEGYEHITATLSTATCKGYYIY